MTVAEYLSHKEALRDTPFVIKPSGHGFFVHKEQLIPQKIFESWHRLIGKITVRFEKKHCSR